MVVIVYCLAVQTEGVLAGGLRDYRSQRSVTTPSCAYIKHRIYQTYLASP